MQSDDTLAKVRMWVCFMQEHVDFKRFIIS